MNPSAMVTVQTIWPGLLTAADLLTNERIWPEGFSKRSDARMSKKATKQSRKTARRKAAQRERARQQAKPVRVAHVVTPFTGSSLAAAAALAAFGLRTK